MEPSAGWEWPPQPVLNAPSGLRAWEGVGRPGSEAQLEASLVGSERLLREFNDQVAPLASFSRQLPLGLFDGRIDSGSRWTPGGNSGVDLWGPSPDGRVVHLFELKKKVKTPSVGIVPEAFYYLRLWHAVRVGLASGGRIAATGAAADAIRRAERLVMWLVAPGFHPLVRCRGTSPLAWLNAGMAANGAEMRILPIDLEAEAIARWRPEAQSL